SRRDHFVPRVLAKFLSRTIRDPFTRIRVWPVGTDGALPTELTEPEREAFCDAMTRCEREIASASSRPLQNNGALRCLTWTFTLCPDNIQDQIVAALEADLTGRNHPLLRPQASRTVLTQGAGRAVASVPRLQRVLHVLALRPANSDTLSALAM